jgi:hypothetical protein
VWLMERRRGVPAAPQRRLNEQARELIRVFENARADPATPADQLAALFLTAKRAEDDALHFAGPWITAPRFTRYHRTMPWLLDARHRQQAAQMAGDGAAAAAEAETLLQRCRPTRPDDAWPPGWDDWPDYPPPEPRT